MVAIRIQIGKRERERQPAHKDDDQQFAGWTKYREPKDEPRLSSLTAGAGADKWAQRAAANSGPRTAPGCGVRKSSEWR